MAEGHQVEKSRYGLDMEGFWPGDKCRIIAISLGFLGLWMRSDIEGKFKMSAGLEIEIS